MYLFTEAAVQEDEGVTSYLVTLFFSNILKKNSPGWGNVFKDIFCLKVIIPT